MPRRVNVWACRGGLRAVRRRALPGRGGARGTGRGSWTREEGKRGGGERERALTILRKGEKRKKSEKKIMVFRIASRG